jgi:FdhD protein
MSTMKISDATPQLLEVKSRKVNGVDTVPFTDVLSVEEPLEIRLTGEVRGVKTTRPVAITMRTPGEDRDLAAGFLFTEGIISSVGQIEKVVSNQENIIEVTLNSGVAVDPAVFERHSFVASSCGVCGKRSIEAVQVRRNYKLDAVAPTLTPELIHSLPAALRAAQKSFDSTGGIHASGLFDADGNLLILREDVGRHNALDKVIGASGWKDSLPLSDRIILVSGRASFELVQKAAHAGTPVLAAVGAPSSLAVQLAQECGMTLLGFVRDNRFNIYTGAERVKGQIKD